MNRGDRREPIFNDDKDRLLFLITLAEACQKNRLADSRVGVSLNRSQETFCE